MLFNETCSTSTNVLKHPPSFTACMLVIRSGNQILQANYQCIALKNETNTLLFQRALILGPLHFPMTYFSVCLYFKCSMTWLGYAEIEVSGMHSE